jgi:hypothetical protein
VRDAARPGTRTIAEKSDEADDGECHSGERDEEQPIGHIADRPPG